MFYAIRRIIIAGWLVTTMGVGYVAETQLGLYNRAKIVARFGVDQFEVAKNYQRDKGKISGELIGRGVKVKDSSILEIQVPGGYRYTIALAGCVGPAPSLNRMYRGDDKPSRKSEALLEQFVLDQELRVRTTHLNANRTGMGIVYVGDLNINLEMIKAGMVQLHSVGKEVLPTQSLQSFEKAELEARGAKVGLWSLSEPK